MEEMMFNLTNLNFKEIYNDPEYFLENKNGLKATIIFMNPYDYIEAVIEKKTKHEVSTKKLNSLKLAYEQGIKVPLPYLIYGSRDQNEDDDGYYFGQEGFNRAYTATLIGKTTIPVEIRYRENDINIPNVVKKYLLKNIEINVEEEKESKNTIKNFLLKTSQPKVNQ